MSWALKGKSMAPWHGEPQDAGAIDRMSVDKEERQGFGGMVVVSGCYGLRQQVGGRGQIMPLGLDMLSLKLQLEFPVEFSSRQKEQSRESLNLGCCLHKEACCVIECCLGTGAKPYSEAINSKQQILMSSLLTGKPYTKTQGEIWRFRNLVRLPPRLEQ